MTTTAEQNADINKARLKKYGPYAGVLVVGLIIGGLIGGAGNSEPEVVAAPEPITVVEEVEVEVFDPNCQEVARVLWNQLDSMTNQVVTPLAEAGAEINMGYLTSDVSLIESATVKVESANGAILNITDQIVQVRPNYDICQASQ